MIIGMGIGVPYNLRKKNYALSFDGVDDYVQAGNVITAYPFTIETWLRRGGTSSNRTVVSLNDTISTYYAISISSGSAIRLAARNGVTAIVSSGTVIPENTWVHVCAVFASPTDRQLYINGQLMGTSNEEVPFFTPARTLIGVLRTSSPLEYMSGSIKDVRIWNIARTQSEIQVDMNRELVGNEPGLVGYWKINEGYGNVLRDFTSNQNHGTINGATWTEVVK